jgi:CHAD domain-containing protein
MRKRAKLARYMVEPAPKPAIRPSANAQRLASRFQALQQTGGEWHDLLQLRKLSAKRLGKSSQLAQHFVERSDKARRAFKRRLSQSVSS